MTRVTPASVGKVHSAAIGNALEATMDGMNWVSGRESEALAQRAADLKEVRTALAMTATSIVLAIAFVLALSATNLRPVMAEEFVSPPITE